MPDPHDAEAPQSIESTVASPTQRSVRYAEFSLFGDPMFWTVPVADSSSTAPGQEEEASPENVLLEPRLALAIAAAAFLIALVPLAIFALR